MNRVLLLLLSMLLALPALAQDKKPVQVAPPLGDMNFKVTLGGLNAGTFNTFDIPSLKIAMNGDDVLVVPTTNAADPRPIRLLDGKVSKLAQKILKDKVGQQMTVQIQVTPLGAKPGKRCSVLLDHAFLKGFSEVSFTFKASGVPKIKCTPGPKG